MAKLLILGKNFNGPVIINTNYRGIMRNQQPDWTLPKYTEKERTILKKAFEELYATRNESYLGYEVDYQIAKKVADLFTQYSESGEKYDLVELTYIFENPTFKSNFFGYDVANGFDSAIAWIFSDANKDRLAPFQLALKEKYLDKLNAHLLFSDLEDAFHFYEEAQKRQPSGHPLAILGLHEYVAPFGIPYQRYPSSA